MGLTPPALRNKIPVIQARYPQGVVVQGGAHEHIAGIRCTGLRENLLLPREFRARTYSIPPPPSFRFLRPEALESFRYLFLCRTHQTFRSRSKEPDKARLKHWGGVEFSSVLSSDDVTSGLSTSSRLSTSCLEAGYYLV